jgi:hypothetical protein
MLPELSDSRRLTGANLFWDPPAAIIDFACQGDALPFIQAWQGAARELLQAVGRDNEQTTFRVFDGGASLLISAPIDALYSMCELNEAAFNAALVAQGGPPALAAAAEATRLDALFAAEANPALLALQAAAAEHEAAFLWDDDAVSIGHGAHAQLWLPRELPGPDDVDWRNAGAIPLALVTGTNGAGALLADAEASFEDVVELTTFHVEPADSAAFSAEFERYMPIHREFFGEHRPAWSAVGTSALLSPTAVVEMRLVAVVGSGKNSRVVRSGTTP